MYESSSSGVSCKEFSLLCSAGCHQASENMPMEARGKQCVTTCLMFLIEVNYVKACSLIQAEDLKDVLFAGSHLYCATCKIIGTSGLLDPTVIPRRIAYKGHTVYFTHKGIKSGLIDSTLPKHSDEIFSDLENAIVEACRLVKNLVIIFNGVSLGIHIHMSKFYVFDSHSRNEEGMSCGDGSCVLGVFDNLSDICCFLCRLSASVQANSCGVQFDLHLLTFKKKYEATPFCIKILENRRGFEIQEIHRRKGNFASLMTGKSFRYAIDDRHIHDSQDSEQETHIFQDSELISLFDKLVSSGPNYVCTCCTQTYFAHFMKNVDRVCQSKRELIEKYCTHYRSVEDIEWICQTCWDAARTGKTPKFWIHNGLKFPVRPNELNLSNLEERLVAPRIPFMQLREMPRGGQVSMKGNIVNVPADVSGTIKSLPRMIDENETIMLKLKRKLSYKHHVTFENIRPNKVFQAAKWLVRNSLLFRNEGIVVNDTWMQQQQDITNYTEESTQQNDESDYQSSGDWTEDDSFCTRPTGNLDTFLQSVDFREFNQVLSVAPGEKSSPIGIFQDFHAEIFSFPTIFCGQPRKENHDRHVPLHYSDICKWELRNVDRRVALCVPNIFFKLKRLQIKQIKDKVSLAIRKCKTRNQAYTAGELLTPGFVDKLTLQDDGYRVLRTLRGSPPYWEAAKRDVFAMIRQLGIPTWFCSFSAAETKWVPLLKSLSNLVQGSDLSLDEIDDLSWQHKCKLIKSDPVTCARYFHNRVQTFIKHVLKHSSHPIGEVLDYFYRVEFQQRGSPHIPYGYLDKRSTCLRNVLLFRGLCFCKQICQLH